MKQIFVAAGLLLSCTSVQAVELQPLVAERIALGDVFGTTYYSIEKDGFQVVMSIASGEQGSPVQFVTTLGAGQKTTLAVPRAFGEGVLMVEISRVDDRLFLEEQKAVTSVSIY